MGHKESSIQDVVAAGKALILLFLLRLCAYEYLLKLKKCESGHEDPCSSKILKD